jgi:hypothetical protein
VAPAYAVIYQTAASMVSRHWNDSSPIRVISLDNRVHINVDILIISIF